MLSAHFHVLSWRQISGPWPQSYSLEKFEQAYQDNIQHALISAVIHHLYEESPPGDNKLRTVVVDILCHTLLHVSKSMITYGRPASHSFANAVALALLKKVHNGPASM